MIYVVYKHQSVVISTDNSTSHVLISNIRHPNKFTNYLRNFDAVAGVGGNPFMLDMQVEPNVFNDIIIRK